MQKIDLSILPQGGINPIIRCSQGDRVCNHRW